MHSQFMNKLTLNRGVIILLSIELMLLHSLFVSIIMHIHIIFYNLWISISLSLSFLTE